MNNYWRIDRSGILGVAARVFFKRLILMLALLNDSDWGWAAPGYSQPQGIYVLDSSAGTMTNGISMRDANIRSNDFVTGYVLRVNWATLEPAENSFDFTIIDWNIRRLAAINKTMSLEFINMDPPWLALTPGVTTWYDTNQMQLRAVPWDPFLLARVGTLLNTVAQHQIDGVKLQNHPTLAVVNFGLAGANLAIRDPASVLLHNMANYSRTALSNAVMANLLAAVTNFPSKWVQTGFWPVLDNQPTPPLWEFIRESILAEFNGVTEPRVGFWQENLAASRPAAGVDPISGGPTTNDLGALLHLSQTNTWVGFQALTSWVQPFTGASKVANATTADGMLYANATYGSTYFEIYALDIDSSAYHASFEEWRARLFPPKQIGITPVSSGSFQLQWESWPGGVYQIESSSDLSTWINAGPSQRASTNSCSWTNTAYPSSQFYRLRILP